VVVAVATTRYGATELRVSLRSGSTASVMYGLHTKPGIAG
jgi:hypothetical protein